MPRILKTGLRCARIALIDGSQPPLGESQIYLPTRHARLVWYEPCQLYPQSLTFVGRRIHSKTASEKAPWLLVVGLKSLSIPMSTSTLKESIGCFNFLTLVVLEVWRGGVVGQGKRACQRPPLFGQRSLCRGCMQWMLTCKQLL